MELGIEFPREVGHPTYRRIPAVVGRGADGIVTTRWFLSWRAIFNILVTRSIWIQVVTKHQRFPAICATAFEPHPDRIDSC